MADDQEKAGPDSPAASERDHGRASRLGQVIDDRYEVVRLLGEGGMGAVYEVRHRVIGRRFAMKFLPLDAARSRSAIARFRREAQAAGRLENENVVAALDVGTAPDGSPYLLLEYLDGEDLGALIRRVGRLPVAKAVDLVIQTCRGLRAAHAHGIVHRDLKPENLFVAKSDSGTDVVKILDFGIAKLTEAESAEVTTNRGLTLGTPYYMSPEQARGTDAIDGRTDIYALGVILYELLTREKPHPGHNATAVIFHLLRQAPVRIESLRPGLPAGLGDVIHRAIAFDASERFPSVAALLDALTPYAACVDTVAPRSSESSPAASQPQAPVSTTAPQVAGPNAALDGGRRSSVTGASPHGLRRAKGALAFVVVLCAVVTVAMRTSCKLTTMGPISAAARSDSAPPRADAFTQAAVDAADAGSSADAQNVHYADAAAPSHRLQVTLPKAGPPATARPVAPTSSSSAAVRERLYEP
jgi:serine/threonine-protein kinase